jgi:hypothetical protein
MVPLVALFLIGLLLLVPVVSAIVVVSAQGSTPTGERLQSLLPPPPLPEPNNLAGLPEKGWTGEVTFTYEQKPLGVVGDLEYGQYDYKLTGTFSFDLDTTTGELKGLGGGVVTKHWDQVSPHIENAPRCDSVTGECWRSYHPLVSDIRHASGEVFFHVFGQYHPDTKILYFSFESESSIPADADFVSESYYDLHDAGLDPPQDIPVGDPAPKISEPWSGWVPAFHVWSFCKPEEFCTTPQQKFMTIDRVFDTKRPPHDGLVLEDACDLSTACTGTHEKMTVVLHAPLCPQTEGAQSSPDDNPDSPYMASFPPSVGSEPPMTPEQFQTPASGTGPKEWDPLFHPNYEFKHLKGDNLAKALAAQEAYSSYFLDSIRSRALEQLLWEFKLQIDYRHLDYKPMHLEEPGKFFISDKHIQDLAKNNFFEKWVNPIHKQFLDDLTEESSEWAEQQGAENRRTTDILERSPGYPKDTGIRPVAICNLVNDLNTINNVGDNEKAERLMESQTPEAKREKERIMTSLLADEFIKAISKPGSNYVLLKLNFLQQYWGWESVAFEYTRYVELDYKIGNQGRLPGPTINPAR